MTHKSMNIVILACETSGDVLGASLLRSLKLQFPDARFSGVGGTEMIAQGFTSLFDMQDVAVMGLGEVLPALPRVLKRIKQVKAFLREVKPDLVVSIDAPDFNFRVLKAVREDCPDTKFIHYVAPTVWAWREKRALKISKFLDGILCLLPFEPPYFEKHGLSACYIGHPLVEKFSFPGESVDAFKGQYVGKEQKSVCVLFGSRHNEIKKMGPIFAEMIKGVLSRDPDIVFLVPALNHLKDRIEHMLEAELGKARSERSIRFINPDERYMAFKACDYAVATSGTVGLELAYAGTRHCIAYKMGKLSYMLAKRLVNVKYAHLANIILDKAFIPEFLQDNCRAEDLIEVVVLGLGTPVSDQDATQTKIIQDAVYGDKLKNDTPSGHAASFIAQRLKSS